MEARPVDVDSIFKVFTACPNDPSTLLLDVRPHKEFKKGHINQAFNPRLATNGKFLADYSQSQYAMPWSQDCWWGKPVVVYGPPSLGKDHPIIKFLTEQQRCASVSFFKQGYGAFDAKYPFLCTTSVKANSYKKFPSLILPGFLYLGDWGDAEQQERLQELKIKRIITVHNHPDRLRPAAGIKHLKIELPDIGSADISVHFNEVFEFLSEAERLKQPVLVHCGAGVSRSACLVMMFLMRSRRWSAQQARDHCIASRSLVCPNDGFWQLLCALEGPLGILNRSDPNATMGFAGADAPAVKLDAQAAGQPVQVRMLSVKEVKMAQEAAEKAAALAAAAAAAEAQTQQQQQHQQQQVQEEQPQQQEEARRDEQQLQERGPDRAGRKRSRSPKGGRNRSKSTSSSSSSDSSSSSRGSDSSSSSSDSDSSGSSKERPKLRRPPKADEHQALQRARRSRSRSRSRGRSRSHSRGRGRSRSRSRIGARRDAQRSRHEHHNGAAHKRGRSRSRSRSRSMPKRHRSSRSRSREQQRGRRETGSGGHERHDMRGQQVDRSVEPAAAGVQAVAAAAAAAGLPEPQPEPQQSGWLVKLEVSKPEGLVGHMLLGPLNIHQRVVFGRAPACDVVLEHLSISRQHAQLTVDLAGAVCLMDLGSAHGTKLNDAWLKSQQQRTVSAGSSIQFGASTRRYKLLEVQKL